MSFVPEVIKGSGVWSSGRTVRDIEGHFSGEKPAKEAVPISGSGAVPGVDFSLSDKVKNALHSGNRESSTSTKDVQGSSSAASPLTGTGIASSSHHDNKSSLDQAHTSPLAQQSATTSSSNVPNSTGVIAQDKARLDEATHVAAQQPVESTSNTTGLSSAHSTSDNATRSSTDAGPHSAAAATGNVGTASTATAGATHGISANAEKELHAIEKEQASDKPSGLAASLKNATTSGSTTQQSTHTPVAATATPSSSTNTGSATVPSTTAATAVPSTTAAAPHSATTTTAGTKTTTGPAATSGRATPPKKEGGFFSKVKQALS